MLFSELSLLVPLGDTKSRHCRVFGLSGLLSVFQSLNILVSQNFLESLIDEGRP